MPPKVLFTKDEIIDTALGIFKKEGFKGISARRIASELQCSTKPIYICFKNIDDVKASVLEKSLKILLTYIESEYTDHIFLNIGIGLLKFVRDNKIIYKSLFMESKDYNSTFNELVKRVYMQMKKDKILGLFSENEINKLFDRMGIFTHGLAALLCAGLLDDDSDEYLVSRLTDIGEDIIRLVIYDREKDNYEQ